MRRWIPTVEQVVVGTLLLLLGVVGVLVAFNLGATHRHRQTVTIIEPKSATSALSVSSSGSDASCARGGTPCASLDRAYQLAVPGDAIPVSGTFGYQSINPRPDLRNLKPGCTITSTAQCIRFVFNGVRVNGQVEVFGSDVWLDGGSDRNNPGLTVSGLIDSATGSSCCAPPTTYPDHLIFSGTRSASMGIFATDTMTWTHADVGPATVTNAPPLGNCDVKEGPGAENKIGQSGVGPTFYPTNILIDDMVIHDQNADAAGRSGSQPCHWGGLFIVNANGMTIQNSIFFKNVVYNVEIQNFVGPPSTNVTFRNDSMGCPVDWLSVGAPCDGQSSIQADGTFANYTIIDSAFGEPLPPYGCYRAPCDFSTWVVANNTGSSLTTTPPPLPGGTTTPTTTPTTTTTSTTTSTTTTTGTTTTTPVTTTTLSEAAARDQGVVALKKTTVGLKNKLWTVPPADSQWQIALSLIGPINGDQNWNYRLTATDELKQTTVGYINRSWKTPPAGSHWALALNALAKIT